MAQDRRALQKVIKTTQNVTGTHLQALVTGASYGVD